MTYRDYYTEHPSENTDWCMPYVAPGGNAIAVTDADELAGIMIDGKDIDASDESAAIKRLAKAVNEYYDNYLGWSDTHIAIDAMKRVGCASCPWFEMCEHMNEIMEEE